eukprot:9868604-Prorocentrum_lima.AAC.1
MKTETGTSDTVADPPSDIAVKTEVTDSGAVEPPPLSSLVPLQTGPETDKVCEALLSARQDDLLAIATEI